MLNVEKKKDKKSPHLALTHNELQGGAANHRNVSLLMKSDVKITPEIAALIKSVTGVDVEPQVVEKVSYQTLYTTLSDDVRKQFAAGLGDWAYIEDFDNQYVVFSRNGELYATTYDVSSDGTISIGSDATLVTKLVQYKAEDDSVVLSGETADNGSIQSLVVKSIDKINNDEALKQVLKSVHLEKDKNMNEEIQKAVDAAKKEMSVVLEKAQADLQKAEKELEDLKKAVQEKADAARQAAVKAVVKDEKEAEELFKAVKDLSEEAFQAVIKTVTHQQEVIEKSELFTRKSAAAEVTKSDEVPLHVKLLREKFQDKK